MFLSVVQMRDAIRIVCVQIVFQKQLRKQIQTESKQIEIACVGGGERVKDKTWSVRLLFIRKQKNTKPIDGVRVVHAFGLCSAE